MNLQVIEVFIRSEEGLSRDMVKHLNQIEEQVLESQAWSMDSALWSALQAAGNKVPTVEEVSVYDLQKTRTNQMLSYLGLGGISRENPFRGLD